MNRLKILLVSSLVIVVGISGIVYINRADIAWLQHDNAQPDITEQSAREALKGMPLVFQENQGQVDSTVKYLVRNGATSIFFTPTEIVYQLLEPTVQADSSDGVTSNQEPIESTTSKAVALRQTFVGGESPFAVSGVNQLKSKVNYFIGNDESKWVRGAPTFSAVQYDNVYDGIGVLFDGAQGRLNYRFDVQPGANPNDIRIRIEGADSLAISADGALVLVTPLGNMGLPKPIATQPDQPASLSAKYLILDENTFTIEVGNVDHTQSLTLSTES